MRFLHLTHSLNPVGGGPRRFIEQAAILQKEFGNEIEVVCLDRDDDPWLAEFPAKVHVPGPAWGSYGYCQALVPWLIEHRDRYDLVVVNGIWQYPSRATWLALKGSSVPYVVFPHGMLDPWFKQAYFFKHLKKVIYWHLAESKVLRDAAAVLFTSEGERIAARESFSPYNVKEKVVGYGTTAPDGDSELQRQAFYASFPELRNKPMLLFLSRIHEKKGCDMLINAFANVSDTYPELQLVLAGPCPSEYQQWLEMLVSGSHMSDRVSFTGMLTGDVKWGALRAAEALVLPSHQENFAQVVAEALSCATPVLISNKVNIWREIADDGAGLVEDDDEAGTEKLLQQWLSLDENARNQMRSAASACFANRFEIHIFFKRYVEELEQIVKARTG